ncbi:MAG TPA: thioesterase family protein [Thermohalobaculum sp.]|nr:thioesterase family protein [Thermohalobaculum sp.]
MTEFDLTRRETYRHWTPVTIRYSDQDSMAHVNNCAFATYVEAARTAFIYELIQKGGIEGVEFILARLVIDYLRELHYPGKVEVGARLIRVGTKSITTGYGVFKDGVCYATAESVNVFYDMATRRTRMPPDSLRAVLMAELAG